MGIGWSKEEDVEGATGKWDLWKWMYGSGENSETGSSVNGTAIPLSVDNIWESSDFLNLILDKLPPSELTPALKSLRLVDSGIRNATLQLWRKTAFVRICSTETYLRLQSNRDNEYLKNGISMEALLAAVENNKVVHFLEAPFSFEALLALVKLERVFHCEEVPLHNFSIFTAAFFPLERHHHLETVFWKQFGPQIKHLRLNCVTINQRGDANGFRSVLELCPNLEEIVFQGHLKVNEDLTNSGDEADNNEKPVFQSLKLKALTICRRSRGHYDCKQNGYCPNHDLFVHPLDTFLKMTPGLKMLNVNSVTYSRTMAQTLLSLARKGYPLKLQTIKMIMEDNDSCEELLEYVELAAPPLESIDLDIGDDSSIETPLKIVKSCKDTLKYLKFILENQGFSDSSTNFEEWNGTTFGALKSFHLTLKYWRKGPLGCEKGCIFPVLTTLKIHCPEFRGNWFNILSSSSFPSLTHLEITFDPYIVSFKTFDFEGFKNMPKLRSFSFKDRPVGDNDRLSGRHAHFNFTPSKIFYNSPPSHSERSLNPQHEYDYFRFENLTEFCYPVRFTAHSLMLISKWFPKIKFLTIGADIHSLPNIFTLFKNVEEITLFVMKADVSEEKVESFKNGFKGEVRILRMKSFGIDVMHFASCECVY